MERSFIAGTALASALVFAGVWVMAAPTPASVEASSEAVADDTAAVSSPGASPGIEPEPSVRERPESPPARDAAPYNVVRSAYGDGAPANRAATPSESSVFYSGCREVRAAGAAPLYRGQPGYRIEMDGDNDGIACEPYY